MVSGPRGQGERKPRPNALDNYYGWNSSMGRDVDDVKLGERVDPQLPLQYQYRDQGRTVMSGNEPAFTDMGRNYSWAAPSSGTPNFREPFKQHPDPKGKRQRERHLQFLYGDPPYGQSDTFTNPYYPEKKHPNPRMRGMGGGLGGLQEQAGLWQDIKRILKRTKNPGPLIDQWTDHWNEQQVAYNPGDYDRPMEIGDYSSIGNRYGENYEDLETIPLDMQFDQFGNPIGGDDYGYFDDTFAARGGLMSLRR